MKTAFRHANPSLQICWNYAQFGLIIFGLSPFLGAVAMGLAALLTWRRQYRTIIRRPLNWGFALLAVLLVISAIFAHNKTEAFLGLFNFLPFFILFAGLSALIQTIAQLRQLSWILVLTSVPIVIMGFGQLFLGWAFRVKFLWIVLELSIQSGGDPVGRMASIFMHANTYAGYLVIVFILGLGLWLENFQQLIKVNSQELTEERKISSPLVLLSVGNFLTVVNIANFAALILTNSRNAWAIALAACLAYAFYQGWRILVAGVTGVATSVLLAAFAPLPIAQFFRQVVPAFFWARLNDEMYPDRPVALMRKTQWEFAWSLTKQHPWVGWGLRNFSQLYKAHMQIRLGHPHNLFLMLSAETGIPATILFCCLVGYILFAGVQLLRQSKYLQTEDRLIFFSYLVVVFGWVLFNTVDVSLFDFRLNTLSWLLLSAVCGAVYRYEKLDTLGKT